MDEPIVTFGLLMGLEFESKQDAGAGYDGTNSLLIFCVTGESEEGKIRVTPRMMDLAQMGFQPVAIARGDPGDIRNYKIFANEYIPEVLSIAADGYLRDSGNPNILWF
jgi:hypothetical protein